MKKANKHISQNVRIPEQLSRRTGSTLDWCLIYGHAGTQSQKHTRSNLLTVWLDRNKHKERDSEVKGG